MNRKRVATNASDKLVVNANDGVSFEGEIESLTPISNAKNRRFHSEIEKMFVELSEQQKSLRCLLENLPAGVILVDSEFRILGGNRTYFRFYSEKALPLGERLDKALPNAEESGLMRLLRHARENSKSIRVRNFRYDGFAKGPRYWSGSIVHLKIPSENGPINAMAVLALDVSEDVNARNRLKELAELAEKRAGEIEMERSRLITLLEAVPVPLLVYDADLNVELYNSAAKQLYEYDAFSPKCTCSLFDGSGNRIKPNNYPLVRSLRGETCSDEIIHWRSPESGVSTFLVNSVPLRDSDDSITGVVVAATDITEQELARKRLQEIYQREHYIADKLQRSFVPYELPEISGFEIAQHYLPALDEELVGGDFYDVFTLGEGQYGVVMADVSGKGLKAAVYTAMTKYMLRAYALRESKPAGVLMRLNAALASCTPPEVFVTLTYAVVDEKIHRLTYANAGHEQPIFYSHIAGFATTLDVTGPALGLLGEANYLEHEISLSAGDIVLFYTDGVTDAGHGCDRLGHEAVLAIIEDHANESVRDICDHILERAAKLSGGKLSDDAAMLLIKTKGKEKI
ncbi:SpoIIE family protein phosphatase [bacterium]|nr:SpoIIE family protein phosphatase [bacterium]